jgi:hypothetical protein
MRCTLLSASDRECSLAQVIGKADRVKESLTVFQGKKFLVDTM